MIHSRFSVLWLLPLALLVLLPELANAQAANPFDITKILPSAIADKPFLEKMVAMIVMVVIAGAFITLGFGVMGGIGDIFTTLSDARRMGEWSLFLKNLGMVLAVVIVGVVLASLIYTWLSTVNISPSVTFGG